MSQLAQLPRRTACDLHLSGIVFNNVLTTATSTAVFCRHFHEFNLMLGITIALAPTDILFSVLFSFDNVTYYKYMNGPFGDLRYEDSAGAIAECISGPIIANWIKLKAVATGTDATNTFTVTAHLVVAR